MTDRAVPVYESLVRGRKKGLPRASRFVFIELCFEADADGVVQLPRDMDDGDAVRDLIGGDRREILVALKQLLDPDDTAIAIDGKSPNRTIRILSWNGQAPAPWLDPGAPVGETVDERQRRLARERQRDHRAKARGVTERDGDRDMSRSERDGQRDASSVTGCDSVTLGGEGVGLGSSLYLLGEKEAEKNPPTPRTVTGSVTERDGDRDTRDASAGSQADTAGYPSSRAMRVARENTETQLDGTFGMTADAYREGISSVTGGKVSTLSPSDRKELQRAIAAHAGGRTGQVLIDFVRDDAARFARECDAAFGGYPVRRYRAWCDAGRKSKPTKGGTSTTIQALGSARDGPPTIATRVAADAFDFNE